MKSTYTGSRAEQLIRGATKIVASLSLLSSITLVASTPGTAHATEERSGMKDFPLSPHFAITRSIKNAARAI